MVGQEVPIPLKQVHLLPTLLADEVATNLRTLVERQAAQILVMEAAVDCRVALA
jgi:hypothetical protein